MSTFFKSRHQHSRLALAILLTAVLALHSVSSSVWADSATEDYNTAVALYKQSRWSTAADRFKAFLKAHDKHEKVPLARLYLGLTLVNLEDFKAAREELRAFVKDYPQNSNLPQARYRIAECSYLMEDLPSARAELDTYLKDYPKDPFQDHALPYLADVQLRLNDPSAALINFQMAIDRFPEGPLVDDARFGRARALEQLKRDNEAIAQFKDIASKQGGSRAADAQFHLGALAFERKRFPEASAAYVDLINRFPNSRFVPVAHLNAGYAFYQSGNFAEAVPQFEAAAQEKTQRATAGYWLGLSLKSIGQFAKAADAFQTAAKSAGDQPLAESILFQQALCERQQGHAVEARQLFATVLSKWSRGDFADDALHAMAELSIESGDLASADQYLARFAKEFPASGLRMHCDLLAGRLDLARAAVSVRDQKPAVEINSLYESAARKFNEVMGSSTIAVTKNQARYYLAFTRQLQGQSALVLQLIAPLIDYIRSEGIKSELADAFVLQADAHLAEKHFDEAEKSAQEYLTLVPQGRQAARATSVLALAAAKRGELSKADAAWERLNKDYPDSPLRAVTTNQLAELADAREDWAAAEKLYEALIPLWNGVESQPYAIRGLAFAQLKQKHADAAAKTYARILKDFPNHRLIAECSYYRAESLKEAGQIDESIATFDELLRKIPADKPAEAGAESQSPWVFSYRAGLQAARLQRKAKKIPEADSEYEELVKRFPRMHRLDQLLDEWALLNYESGRYERADIIFRRIVSETPDSDRADNARLSLAESDLLADRLDVAKAQFEQLLASDKSDAEVKEVSLYQLLVLAVHQQRWGEVRQLADRLATQFPNSQHRWYATYSIAESILANPKSSEADLEDARQRLNLLRKESENSAVTSFPWYDRVWVLLAEVAFSQKKYDDLESTVAELRQRAEKSPFLFQAEEVLGRGYKQQAPPKFDDARKAFERALADPAGEGTATAAKCRFLIGETYFLQEKWDDAFLAYQNVYANYSYPEWQAAALLQSGKCDEQRGKWTDAAATYRLLIKEFPKVTAHVQEARQRLEVVTKKPGVN